MSGDDLSIDIGTFTAKGTISDRGIEIVCAGECDLAALDPFDTLLKAAHAVMVVKAGELVLDLREVSFMNSSCLMRTIHWISTVRELPPAARYRVRIRSNPKMSWQRRSLNALQCFAVDLITIES